VQDSVTDYFAPKPKSKEETVELGPKKVKESTKRWGAGVSKSYFGLEFISSM
jgi:hypothetical protein